MERKIALAACVLAAASTTVLATAQEEPQGDVWTPAWGFGAVRLAPGHVPSRTQPWNPLFRVWADNAAPSHFDAAVVLDSGTWPGGGAPTGVPLLALADQVVDADGDGLVDSPSPEPAGGMLAFDFPGLVQLASVTLFDVEEPGAHLRISTRRDQHVTVPVAGASDQLTHVWVGLPARRLEVVLPGDGAVARLQVFLCPTIVDFDQSTTCAPLGLQHGAELGQEYGEIGLFGGAVTAVNANPAHPDRALVYDSAAAGGGSSELITPGPGTGNVAALGNVLVIAADDRDDDLDGLVDAPASEPAGGVLRFTWFTNSVRFQSVTVVDVDPGERSFVRIWSDDGPGFLDVPLQELGDNSVQTVSAHYDPTRQIEVHLGGTAAVAELRVCRLEDL